jgi:hypothetical protein
MAARISLALAGLSLALVATGCQPQSNDPHAATTYPPPSFGAPHVDPNSATATSSQSSSSQSQHTLPQINAPAIGKIAPRGPYAANGPKDWAPAAHARPWKWVILHHSATPSGGARKFDADHRARGFDDLGYDFVIGNGTETANGQIEVGPRWHSQRVGAHTQDPSGQNRFNEYGIGVCFVGNFDITHPTQAQLNSCAKLVAYLMKTYHIPADHILRHRDCKHTDCPGNNFPFAQVRKMAVQTLADAGEVIPTDTYAEGAELGTDDPRVLNDPLE